MAPPLGFIFIALSSLGLCAETANVTCGERVEFTCNQTDSNGACSNLTEIISFGNWTADEDGFIGNVTVTSARTKDFLQPNTGTRTWVSATGQNCSIDPCTEPNPCLNGKCTPLDGGPKLFECDCNNGYSGDWCEVPDKCGESKCDENADCRDEKCYCRDGYGGEGTYCTPVCTDISFTNTDKFEGCAGVGKLDFKSVFDNQRQYSNQRCNNSEPRPIGYIDCVTIVEDGKNVSKFDTNSLKCLECNATIQNTIIRPEEAENLTSDVVKEYVEKLQILTEPPNKPEQDITEVVESLETISKILVESNTGELNETKPKIQIDIPTMQNVLLIVSHIGKELPNVDTNSKVTRDDLEPTADFSEKDQNVKTQTQKGVKIIDDFARAVNLTGRNEIEIVTNNMSLVISEPPEDVELVYEPEAFVPESEADKETSGKPESESQVAKKKTITLTIPKDAVAKMRKLALASGSKTMRVVLVLYQDARMLTFDKRTGKVIQASYKSGDETESGPTSIGTSFSLRFSEPNKKTPTQEKQLEHTNMKIVETYFCVFYDFMLQDWSDEGCTFDTEKWKEFDVYECSCTHFTSFALLLRITKVLDDFSTDYYSIVLCSISVVCLVITVIIYLSVRDLRVRRPTPIMVNICLNLVIGFLFFLVGMDGKRKNFSDAACYTSAIIMHISFLGSWFWMLIYSLNMYYALVKIVGASPLVSKKAFMYTLGYGVPVLIVVIDLIVSLEVDKTRGMNDSSFEKSYIATHICWIRHLSMYIAFTGPVGVILFINMILFFIIIRKLTWKRQEIQSTKERANLNQQILMAITMMSMMGLTWIFGYLMLVSEDPGYQTALEVLFNIFNTCQGIVIFCMSCVRQKGVRDLWVGPIRRFFGCHQRKKAKGMKTLNESTTNASQGYTGMTTLPRLSKDVNSTTAL
uniref:uncharacterized protein LOC120341889 n=1 Tax=Styela clava TaxID=7725 RepID=UPI00193AD620|nr:uncharacterized protein LOC120341889 [Styela clava]